MLNTLATGMSHCSHRNGTIPKQSAARLLALTDAALARVDPVEMNLLVAKGIPALANLDVRRYQRMADEWAGDIQRRLPGAEIEFHKTPRDWKNDFCFFRLGMVCWYVDQVLGIRYRKDQRDLKRVIYTDPSDLFLNGVMDTRRGTCGNIATLHVALGWRLGWPVSLACVGSHYLGEKNPVATIHWTSTSEGPPDEPASPPKTEIIGVIAGYKDPTKVVAEWKNGPDPRQPTLDDIR